MILAPPILPLSLVAMALSLALLGGGGWLLYQWWVGAVVGTGVLLWSLGMLAWTCCGRWLLLPLLGRKGRDDPHDLRGVDSQRLTRPDGTELHVERWGPDGAPPLVLIHGWGMNNDDWYYAKRALSDRYRILAWDIRGLGRSSRPPNHDYSLETLAQDLDAVLDLAGGRPAVVAGHSIGGMIALTYCRVFHSALRRRIAGIALVNTTFTNPVRTTTVAGLFTALQKPVLEPLMHLVIWTSPLVWLVNWLSYQNGTGLIVTRLTGFAGSQSRGQLDYATRVTCRPAPATLARGVLAMLRYDASDILKHIPVPVLVVTGSKDRILVPEASAHLRDMLPNASLVSLSPAGHMSLYERHADLIPALAAFADRCGNVATGEDRAAQQRAA